MVLLVFAGLLALRAYTNELQEMVLNSEASAFCQPPLDIHEVAIFEVHHFSATRTYKVVMVFHRSPNNILAGIAACPDFTYQAKVRKYAKCAVHSGKA